MEDALAEMVGTLEIMSKNYVGETCSEFRALVLGIGNTRESLEAWCNFKSDNKDVSLSDNTAIKSPLLSRFDLVLTLLDAHSLAWDKLVSAKLLDGPPAGRAKRADVWSTKKLHLYFQHVQSLKPVLSSRAEKVIVSSRLWTYMSLLLRC